MADICCRTLGAHCICNQFYVQYKFAALFKYALELGLDIREHFVLLVDYVSCGLCNQFYVGLQQAYSLVISPRYFATFTSRQEFVRSQMWRDNEVILQLHANQIV